MELTIDNLHEYKHIHLIGIGGVSMSAIAETLHNWNHKVTGSDAAQSELTDRLNAHGIQTTIGHNTDIAKQADLIIYSAAISEQDPEMLIAKEYNIPTIGRGEFVGLLTKKYKESICIAGTHGKTTTTSMISICFVEAQKDPTVQVGAILKNIGGNYVIGNSDYFILESCEYKANFLKFFPNTGIILNIDNDHLDYYKTFENVIKAFKDFALIIEENGLLVTNADDENCLALKDIVKCNFLSYGINNKDANYVAENISYDKNGFATFDVYKNKEMLGTISLSIAGTHNILNALACIATCDYHGIDIETIKKSLKSFTGASRRLEYKGEISRNDAKVLLYADDYNDTTGALDDLQPYLTYSTGQENGKIPSTEQLAIRAKMGAWMLSYHLRRVSGKDYVRIYVTVPYRTQYEKEDETLVVKEKKIQIFNGNDRPIAVMIDNHTGAWPQANLNKAYLVYEIVVEGGETRLMALFKGQDLEQIGPVRSSRHYFLDYALENDAIYVHHGWSPQAESDISKLKVNNINGIQESSKDFSRVKDKSSPHNMFTSTASILKIAERKEYKTTSSQKSVLNYVAEEFVLTDKYKKEIVSDETSLDAEDTNRVSTETTTLVANSITIPHSKLQTVRYEYDEKSKTYTRYARNKLQTDYVTGESVTTKNIIITMCDNYTLTDKENKGRQGLKNIGTFDGYYITNGNAIKIKCTKTDRDEQTIYKDLDGKEIEINDGNTFINICPTDAKIIIE